MFTELEHTQIRRHGLTAADKKRIADEQRGCGLCGRLEPGRKGWVVDHDRSCCSGDGSCLECRRAILCQWCNNALGYAFDSPVVLRRMADYLELMTRLHPSHVWKMPQSTDQSTDGGTESVDRLAPLNGTDVTDGTDIEVTTSPLKSFRSVPRARIFGSRQVECRPAALRARLIGGIA